MLAALHASTLSNATSGEPMLAMTYDGTTPCHSKTYDSRILLQLSVLLKAAKVQYLEVTRIFVL